MQVMCLSNRNHKRFVTVAHVTQDWVVDEVGNFIEEVSTNEITHGPSKEKIY